MAEFERCSRHSHPQFSGCNLTLYSYGVQRTFSCPRFEGALNICGPADRWKKILLVFKQEVCYIVLQQCFNSWNIFTHQCIYNKLNAFITCIICTIKMYILSPSCWPDPKLPSVKIIANDGRDQLWGKTKASFKYVYDHHLQDADWFMKADDDTWGCHPVSAAV